MPALPSSSSRQVVAQQAQEGQEGEGRSARAHPGAITAIVCQMVGWERSAEREKFGD